MNFLIKFQTAHFEQCVYHSSVERLFSNWAYQCHNFGFVNMREKISIDCLHWNSLCLVYWHMQYSLFPLYFLFINLWLFWLMLDFRLHFLLLYDLFNLFLHLLFMEYSSLLLFNDKLLLWLLLLWFLLLRLLSYSLWGLCVLLLRNILLFFEFFIIIFILFAWLLLSNLINKT